MIVDAWGGSWGGAWALTWSYTVDDSQPTPLGNLGPQFFQPMSATIGREDEPERVVEPEIRFPTAKIEPEPAEQSEPQRTDSLDLEAWREQQVAMHAEVRAGTFEIRADLEAITRRRQQEEEEAIAIILMMLVD